MVLDAVVKGGRSLDDALDATLHRVADTRDQAFVRSCIYGVLRNHFSLSAELAGYLGKPLRARDSDVQSVLLCALYELGHMRVPAHATVASAVDAVRAIGKTWATGLVNGVLRARLRQTEKNAVEPGSDGDHFEHPAWLRDRTRADWPHDWQRVLRANNDQAPLTLRVDTSRVSREDYLAQLEGAGIAAESGRHSPAAVTLSRALPVEQIPGFAGGLVSVQDEAAQLAAGLLELSPGLRVLDACAAPGGKTGHIVETLGAGETVVAIDRDAQRLAGVASNLQRQGRECRLLEADAADVDGWWDGVPFDRILLDAPCSAVGVIRRHPDIRFHRRESDLDALAAAQTRLLRALWPLLRPGGSLLYATCSYLRAENDEVIEAFLSSATHVRADRLDTPWGHETRYGRQILPGTECMDGFYYARLRRSD